MTPNRAALTDRVIEIALERRVAGHADDELLAAIVGAASRAQQVNAPWSLRGRPRVAWALLAAATLLIAGLIAIGAGAVHLVPTPRPLPSPFAVVPLQSAPALGPAGAGCADVVTLGSAMTPSYADPMTIPEGVLDRGVYLTGTTRGSEDPFNLWAISSTTATRIAQVTAPQYSVMEVHVEDLSRDGRHVLLRVTGSGPAGCDAAFVVAFDGSRIVRSMPGPLFDGSFSSSGRFAAFSTGNGVLVFEVGSNAAPRNYPCEGNRGSVPPRWSPADDRLLAECGTTTEVIDAITLAVTTIEPPWPDEPHLHEQVWDMGWTDASTFFVVSTRPDPDPRTWWRIVSIPTDRSGSAAPPDWSKPIQGAIGPSGRSISRDGRTSAVWPDSEGRQAGSDGTLVDIATGRTTQFAKNVVAVDEPIAWSSDGRSVLWRVAPGVIDADSHLVVHDLASGRSTMPGDLPFSIAQGIWRLP